jgi:multiple sugar transport system ATP-binding protein
MAFPLRSPARRVDEPTITRRVTEIAALLHIEGKLENRATQLSGGEMQRVAIGRALVRRPAIYLMDEPLSSLDAKLRAELRLELKRIQRDLGATLLYVTHDQIEAMTMAERIGVLESGRLVQVGTPQEIYEQPRNIYVATRLGTPRINLLPADLLPVDGQPSGARQVGARTEHIRIVAESGAPGTRPGKVDWIEHLGDQNHVHVQVDGHTLVSLVEPDSPLRVGDQVGVGLKGPLYFDHAGDRIASGRDDTRDARDG